MLKDRQEGEKFKGVEQDWLAYDNEDVSNHYPPQIIIGKQVNGDKELVIYDENPFITVTVFEIYNEYNYSNPTGYFNLSLPHIELRTNMYSTMNYTYYKKMMHQNIINAKKAYKEQEEEKVSEQTSTTST